MNMFTKLVRWLWPPDTGPAVPSTRTGTSSDPSVVTIDVEPGPAEAVFDVEVTGLSEGCYRASFATLPPFGTPLIVSVGQTGVAHQVVSQVKENVAATAEDLTTAAHNFPRMPFLAATNGTLLHLVSLTPGVDGVLTLDGPPGAKIDPDSEQAIGSAVFMVDQRPSPLATGTANKTSPSPGVTLTAHRNGRAKIAVGYGPVPVRMPGAVLVVAVVWIIVLGVIGLQYPHIAVRWFGSHSYLLKYTVLRARTGRSRGQCLG